MAFFQGTMVNFEVYMDRLWAHLTGAALNPSQCLVEFGGTGLPNAWRVTVPDSAISQEALNTLLIGFGALTVQFSKSAILADGVDETAISVQGLTTFNFKVYKNAVELVSQGTVNDGVLELSAIDAGHYVIEIISGTQTGYGKVQAL